MLQHEFEKLIGAEVNAKDFNEVINPMYENAGDIDKTTFCKDWLKHNVSIVLQEINKTAINQHSKINELEKINKATSESLDNCAKELDRLNGIIKQYEAEKEAKKDDKHIIAEYLIKQAEEKQSRTLAREAIDLVGMYDFIMIKLEKGYRLYENDKDYIIETLGTEYIYTSLESAQQIAEDLTGCKL